MNAEKRRRLGGVCSYSTKQMILHREQHEYENRATDALCWTSDVCKLFCLSFWCISSPFTNGFVLNIQERSWGVGFGYSGCCRHAVRACRVRCAGAAQSCGRPLNSRVETGLCFQTPLRQGKGGEPQPGDKSNAVAMGSFSFFLLIWVYYPLLWIPAGGQCYLKTWLLSKAHTHVLHIRNADR